MIKVHTVFYKGVFVFKNKIGKNSFRLRQWFNLKGPAVEVVGM